MGNETSAVLPTATGTISCASSTAQGSVPSPFAGDAGRLSFEYGFAIIAGTIVAGFGMML